MLVCLNGPVGMDFTMQRDLFTAVLDTIEQDGDLVNQVLEATLATDDSEDITIERYDLAAYADPPGCFRNEIPGYRRSRSRADP